MSSVRSLPGNQPQHMRYPPVLSFCTAIAAAVIVGTLVGICSLALHAGQSRTVAEGVYTQDQAARGQAVYKTCAPCHGQVLEGDLGPPLTGDDFVKSWNQFPLSDLVIKIQNTMPQNDPGTLTRQQTADVVAYILTSAMFPAGKTELSADDAALKQISWPTGNVAPPKPSALTTTPAAALPPIGNMAQVMRGILFPSSNIIFNVQSQDPAAKKTPYVQGTTAISWVDWGAGIYPGWDLVDYAAIAIAESAPLLLTPGRRCENGKPVPVARADWIKYTAELVEAGRAAYRASQSRNQEAVIEVTDLVATACLNCHEIYRDKPGGTTADPSNKAARCVP